MLFVFFFVRIDCVVVVGYAVVLVSWRCSMNCSFLFGVGLILVSNVVVFVGVWYNRSGEL